MTEQRSSNNQSGNTEIEDTGTTAEKRPGQDPEIVAPRRTGLGGKMLASSERENRPPPPA